MESFVLSAVHKPADDSRQNPDFKSFEEQIRDRYYKVDVTLSGLITAGHLFGGDDLDSALKGKFPWGEAEDENGTSALSYMRDLGGLDLEEVLGGIK